MALGSIQPLTEMSTRSISWGWRRPVRKGDNLLSSCAVVMKSGNLNFLEPSGPVQVCNGTLLPLLLLLLYVYVYMKSHIIFIAVCIDYFYDAITKQILFYFIVLVLLLLLILLYIRRELWITGILDKTDEYRRNWLSHLQRMPQNRIALKSYHYRPQGSRTIGRPKKRWREQL